METAPLRVLIVEDHLDIAANVGDFLEAREHVVDFAYDGAAGRELASSSEYDALIVDIGLPGTDGLTLCEGLRASHDTTPILLLTARDTLPDKLAGFHAGADDYLTKPFALEELYVRLQSIVRRGRARTTNLLQVDDLVIDIQSGRVHRSGREISLSPMSFSLLLALAQASPGLVSRETLQHRLWGSEPPESDALRSQIYVLRRAVDRPFPTSLVQTVHGTGYRLAAATPPKAA